MAESSCQTRFRDVYLAVEPLKGVDLSDNSEVHERSAVADHDHRWSRAFKVLRSASNAAVS
jgi:hypothetical protein